MFNERWHRIKLTGKSVGPVVCWKTRSGDEGGRAHKEKVISCLVVALQSLVAGNREVTVTLIIKQDKNKQKGVWQKNRRTLEGYRRKNQLNELRASHQVWFRCSPACVGLPETQGSISIHNPKLQKTSTKQISHFAVNRIEWSLILHLTYILKNVCAHSLTVNLSSKTCQQPHTAKHHLHN